MFKRFIPGTAAALVAAIVLLSGCGSDHQATSGEATETAPTRVVLKPQAPLARADFIQRADAICANAYEKRGNTLVRYARRAGSLTDSEKEQVISSIVIPDFRHELEELEAFAKRSAPKGDEAKLEALLEAFASSLQEGEEDPAKILAGAPTLFAEVTKLAEEYGFQACRSF